VIRNSLIHRDVEFGLVFGVTGLLEDSAVNGCFRKNRLNKDWSEVECNSKKQLAQIELELFWTIVVGLSKLIFRMSRRALAPGSVA
jgi:hypothetical protein